MLRSMRAGVVGCLVILLLITLGYAPRAHATTFTVNTEGDLRTAITSAVNGDTISFNANVTLTQSWSALPC